MTYKLTAVATLLTLASAPSWVVADTEEVINPADLTRVYTQVAAFINSDADIRTTAMMTGAWSENIQFAGFIEGTFGNNEANLDGEHKLGFNYQRGRAQYFQVHATESSLFPRVGSSTDVIHLSSDAGTLQNSGLDDTLLLSAGAIGLINPAFTPGFMAFPNMAYTTGKVFGESADGYMLNLFITKEINDSGAFIQFWPEYINTSGDVVKMQSYTTNILLNSPIKSDRTQWLLGKIEYGSAEYTLPGGQEIKGNNELNLEIGLKFFL
ncbi:hypothetical protein [Vibrio methylphosphonaticus]|uniref:hypothetical protein n=1 Tax=Vibrio methylphosphonaticus TaxID=2946866 RepID=UPI002029F2CC|nr:hypothetical protein [Vibrio methylphosphonaticus]MCL9774004.1 hypothetical protein [Vibrio methylphosphonaticus]